MRHQSKIDHASAAHTNPSLALLALPSLCCSGANLMGYIKCSKAAQNQIKGKFNSLFASGLRAYM